MTQNYMTQKQVVDVIVRCTWTPIITSMPQRSCQGKDLVNVCINVPAIYAVIDFIDMEA